MISFLSLTTLLAAPASADDLSLSETSYIGATILEGDLDITFSGSLDIDYESSDNVYSFFEGNTLYVGNSDEYGNSVDGIIEFFWFQSSIDRGSDFYVAVIKTRATPGQDCPWYWGGDCSLWADEIQDWGEAPVLSVEAITDVNREQGAFRWDWAVPFENYGIDAYGQVTFSNSYGIGGNAEGAVMAHGEYPITEDGSVQAAGNVQVKGYVNSDYRVQTQYEVTLYEWDIYVNGRADLMAWDMYLNLGARDDQSAYHEYFMSIQVEEGQTFMLDELNISSNFDYGATNITAQELGLSLQGIEISAPFWQPEEEEEDEWDWEDWEDEEDEEDDWDWEDEEEEEEVVEEEEEESDGEIGDPGFDDDVELPSLSGSEEPIKGGCSIAGASTMGGLGLSMLLVGMRRRED